jgi:hypothetical protein
MPDPSGPGDGAGGSGERTTRTKSPSEATTCTVRGGEEVQLPKGAVVDGKKIPPGAWSVPKDIPEAGLSLVVSCGTQTLTLLLTKSGTPPGAVLTRSPNGFTGRVPLNGAGKPSILVRNHSNKTAVIGDAVLVTSGTCLFAAPELDPGACSVSVTQGGATASYDAEAVAAKLRWDSPEAAIGDIRTLSLFLEGASNPAGWMVSGTFSVENAELLFVDPRVQTGTAGEFAVQGLRGDAGLLVKVKAVRQGKMIATSNLKATKSGEK